MGPLNHVHILRAHALPDLECCRDAHYCGLIVDGSPKSSNKVGNYKYGLEGQGTGIDEGRGKTSRGIGESAWKEYGRWTRCVEVASSFEGAKEMISKAQTRVPGAFQEISAPGRNCQLLQPLHRAADLSH